MTSQRPASPTRSRESSARMVRRGLLALWCLLTVVASSLGFGQVSATAATTHHASSPPVQVGLATLSPRIPSAGSTLRLGGTLHNTGRSTVRGISLMLRVSAVDYRYNMQQPQSHSGAEVLNKHVGSLAGGASRPWQLSVVMSSLHLPSGVYAMDIEAVGTTNPAVGGVDVGDVWTYVPWNIGSSPRVQLAMMWPLISEPAVDGNQQGSQDEFTNDDLARDIAPGGRLSTLLTDANGLNVSWVVDPDLLSTVATMTSGYDLRSSSGTATAAPGSAAANARAWLQQASSAVRGSGDVWALPYADPDLLSIASAPSSVSRALTGEIDQSTSFEQGEIQSQLGVAPKGLLAWPAGGQAGPATLALAARLHPADVVLSGESALQRTPGQIYTPSARATVNGMTTTISDPALDAVLNGDPADAHNGAGSAPGLLAGQRFIAETALIESQVPQERTILVSPPRQFDPSADLIAAMHDASGAWVRYTGLSSVIASKPDPQATVSPPWPSTASLRYNRSPATLNAITKLSQSLGVFASILTTPGHVTVPYQPVLLRALAASWRSDPAGAAQYLQAATAGLNSQRDNVYMVPRSEITLSGRSGQLPITLVNNLRQPVRLRLAISVGVPNQLHVVNEQVVTIGTSSQQTVRVSARASVSGAVVPVTVKLLTPNGQYYGPPQTILVRVTNIGVIALVILSASAALLVLMVTLRLYRAARRKRHTGGDGPDAAGPLRPEFDGGAPGSPAGDTTLPGRTDPVRARGRTQ